MTGRPSSPDRLRLVAKLGRKAGPALLVTAIIPAGCFLAGRALWGLTGAIGLAAFWNVSCQALRWYRGKPLSGILILGMISLAARASVALALHSAQMYYLVPSLVTAATGLAYIGSGLSRTPLVARILQDLVPETVLDVDDPRMARLLRKGSFCYGSEQIAVSIVSVLMLHRLSTTAYVAIHPSVSWAVLVLGAVLAFPSLRRELVPKADGPAPGLFTFALDRMQSSLTG